MHEDLLIGLTIISVLSISAQWLAWRIKLPSILLLLLFGILAGPVLHIIDIDSVLGELLFPIVSLSVAIILFEGGLSLRLEDLPEIGRVVWNLITIGAVSTWVLSALAAKILLNLEWDLSFLIGAILVVTGPTVVIPLLNQIRPSTRVSSILRWEGIIIDPVGAVLTVLVFEQILGAQINSAFTGIVATIVVGVTLGVLMGRLLIEAFRRYLVPDNLQNPVVLMMVVAGLTISNYLQPESGLLTVTIMGIVMANQKRFDVVHIVEFKENLQVLLISAIFIILAARLEFGMLSELGIGVILFIIFMLVVERPFAVWISAIGSGLSWREKLFISWMAPRGIVAASIASIFSIELQEHGYEDAGLLVPITFSVIIATVTIYGLTSGLVARWLGLVQVNPQGVFFVGAHRWARQVAQILHDLGYRVVLADSNLNNVERAIAMGLEAHHGNILTEPILDEINLSGIGNMIAMTPNDEVNSLASLHFKGLLDPNHVYQLPRQTRPDKQENLTLQLGGKNLFGSEVTYDFLSHKFGGGAELITLKVTRPEAIRILMDKITPLFTSTHEHNLFIWTVTNPPSLDIGQTLVALVDPQHRDEILAAATVSSQEEGV